MCEITLASGNVMIETKHKCRALRITAVNSRLNATDLKCEAANLNQEK